MSVAEQTQHLGDAWAMADHDHDLVQELSKRSDGVWRYDQYIANAEGKEPLQQFWRDLKEQDQANVRRLKDLIAGEVKQEGF